MEKRAERTKYNPALQQTALGRADGAVESRRKICKRKPTRKEWVLITDQGKRWEAVLARPKEGPNNNSPLPAVSSIPKYDTAAPQYL